MSYTSNMQKYNTKISGDKKGQIFLVKGKKLTLTGLVLTGGFSQYGGAIMANVRIFSF